MRRRRSLPGFEDRSLPDRYCDLVLTGGVTSAIAYPGVIHGLAQVYRFNAIGGSSSGAGSAALAAAAEYRRRHGSSDGFRTLLERTAAVADDFKGKGPSCKGQTGLAWLFQPDPWSRRLFAALRQAFAGPKGRFGQLLGDLARLYRGPMVGGLALGVGITLSIAWLLRALCGPQRDVAWIGFAVAAFFIGIFVALAMLAGAIWRDLKRAADADYGLCSGQHREPDAPHPPLTEWLHALIQDIAGLPHDRPLTFADLWAAPGGPRETLGDASGAGARSIDLAIFAANASLGRPLLLPQGDEGSGEPTLYFRAGEMARLFPAAVVAFMVGRSQPYDGPAAMIEPGREEPAPGEPLYPLPRAELPIVVAARMSVSFPVLFSAVPLWQREPGGRRFRRMLFVDGGLCSNFPIHLFDTPVPAWPTFGVSLREADREISTAPADAPDAVHLPGGHAVPAADRWRAWDSRQTPLARIGGFAAALLETTKDWNDALVAELPGVRERIVQIELPAGIGGFNILMNREQIEWLALAGGEAARQLLQRYAAPGAALAALPGAAGGAAGPAVAPGWREHRWVRFNVLADCLQESLAGLTRSVQAARHAEPLGAQIQAAAAQPPLAGEDERALAPAEAAALQRALEAMLQAERLLAPRTLAQPYRPRPRPRLRIRPPL